MDIKEKMKKMMFGNSKTKDDQRPSSPCEGDLTDHLYLSALKEGVPDSHERVERYQKSIFRPENIYGKNVAVVGTGALGSQVTKDLIQLGVNVILIDPDEVEASNLSRSYFTEEDIGLPKSIALARRVENFRNIEDQFLEAFWESIQTFREKYTERIEDIDFMVIAIDNDQGIMDSVDLCNDYNIPYSVSTVSKNSYWAQVYVNPDPNQTEGCYWDFNPNTDRDDGGRSPCDENIPSPSIIYPHSVCAGITGFCVKAILNEEELGYREININLKTGELYKREEVEVKEDCPICSKVGRQKEDIKVRWYS